MSAAFAVRFLLFGAVGPFAAALLNRFGVKRICVFALVLIAAGVVGSFWMTGLWQLFLLWGVVVGLGTGFTAMVLGATVATRWFVASRGLVVGLLSASVATGQVLFLPAFAALSEAWGWRLFQPENSAQRTAVLDAVLAVAGELDVSPDQVAIAWAGTHGAVPIICPRSLTQLSSNLGALTVELTADQLERLDAVSAIVPASSARKPIPWSEGGAVPNLVA